MQCNPGFDREGANHGTHNANKVSIKLILSALGPETDFSGTPVMPRAGTGSDHDFPRCEQWPKKISALRSSVVLWLGRTGLPFWDGFYLILKGMARGAAHTQCL